METHQLQTEETLETPLEVTVLIDIPYCLLRMALGATPRHLAPQLIPTYTLYWIYLSLIGYLLF